MKPFFTLLVCILALAANANYTITVTTSPQMVGRSGQSWFDVSFAGGGNFTYASKQLWSMDGDFNPLLGNASPFSALAVDNASTLKLGSGNTYASGNTYQLLVDWVLRDSAIGAKNIFFNLGVKNPSHAGMNVGATDLVNVCAVPEPSIFLVFALVLAIIAASLACDWWFGW